MNSVEFPPKSPATVIFGRESRNGLTQKSRLKAKTRHRRAFTHPAMMIVEVKSKKKERKGEERRRGENRREREGKRGRRDSLSIYLLAHTKTSVPSSSSHAPEVRERRKDST